RFINLADPPQCEGPVEAARPTAHALRLAPAGAVYGSTQPDTDPSRRPVGRVGGARRPAPGTAGMLRQNLLEAHVRLGSGRLWCRRVKSRFTPFWVPPGRVVLSGPV